MSPAACANIISSSGRTVSSRPVDLRPSVALSSAVYCEVVQGAAYRSISVDRYVQSLVHGKVVARAVPNDAEVVHQRKLGCSDSVQVGSRDTCSLIYVAADFAHSSHPHGLKLDIGVQPAVIIDRGGHEEVEVAAQ